MSKRLCVVFWIEIVVLVNLKAENLAVFLEQGNHFGTILLFF
jgi:hypothetical protein